MKPLRWIVIVIAVAATVGAGIIGMAQERRRPGGAPGAGGGQPPTPVLVAPARHTDVPVYLDGVGTVQAYNSVVVRAQIDGRLISINFREGQDVRRGDVLARIDPTTWQAQLDQAMAKLAQDQAQLANARLDLQRYQRLSQGDYTTRQQADTQRAMVAQLEAQIRSDQGAVDNARAYLGYTTITAPIDGRVGIRQIDEGNIIHASDANGIVNITQVRPISIMFSLPQQNLREINQALAASAQALAASAQALAAGAQTPAASAQPPAAAAEAPAASAEPPAATDAPAATAQGRARRGQGQSPRTQAPAADSPAPAASVPATPRGRPEVLAVGSDNRTPVDRGELEVIDNQVDQTTGTIRMKATFPNAELQLWPGQFVNVRLRVRTLRNAVVVPTAAVQMGPQGPFVYVVGEGDVVTVRRVVVGPQDDVQAVIAENLEQAERVVTTGFTRLFDGGRVTVAEAPAQAPPTAGPRGRGRPPGAANAPGGQGPGSRGQAGRGTSAPGAPAAAPEAPPAAAPATPQAAPAATQ